MSDGVHPTIVVLRDRLVLVDLDLHAALGRELRHLLRLDNLPEYRRVPLALETVVERVQVGSSDEVVEVQGLQSAPAKSFASFAARLTLLMSNSSGSGARFGPDQNGVPFELTWSFGKLNKSCLISLT